MDTLIDIFAVPVGLWTLVLIAWLIPKVIVAPSRIRVWNKKRLFNKELAELRAQGVALHLDEEN